METVVGIFEIPKAGGVKAMDTLNTKYYACKNIVNDRHD